MKIDIRLLDLCRECRLRTLEIITEINKPKESEGENNAKRKERIHNKK